MAVKRVWTYLTHIWYFQSYWESATGLLYFPFAPLHLSNSKFPDKQAENAVLKLITEDKIKPPSGAFALTTMAPNADQPVWCRPQGRCAIVWQQAMLRVDFQWSCPWWCSREGFHINFPRKKLDSEEPLGKYFSCYVNHKGDEEPCDNAVDWSDIQYWWDKLSWSLKNYEQSKDFGAKNLDGAKRDWNLIITPCLMVWTTLQKEFFSAILQYHVTDQKE